MATVIYVDQQDALKVDKITGKGLSTNDFTDTLKTKLDGIQEGAEVNVNADWNAVSGDAEILNKPTIPVQFTKTSDLINDGEDGINPFITSADIIPQVNSDWNATSGVAEILNKPIIPSIDGLATVIYVDQQDALKVDKVTGSRLITSAEATILSNTSGVNTGDQDLSGKVDKITGYSLTKNDFTDTLKTKLDGIAAGAEVNVNADWNATSGDAEILNKPTIPAAVTKTSDLINDGEDGINPFITLEDIPVSGLTSVGLSMPVAFNVANSPLTSDGTIAVSAAGTSSQYIRGDGQLATLPSSGGGGASVFYYLNGSIAASVATYKQLSNTAVIGTGTDFTLTGNGLITQFLTDAGNPNRLQIPSGAWNFEMFFSMSSSGSTPKFYVELLKYNGTTFTTIANNSAVPETISGGTSIDLYLTSLAVPETTLLLTDRLAIRVYIVNNSGGRTATLHTENSHLCQIITTFASGIAALNGLTSNNQYLTVGTSGTDFNISSVSETHTFNLPTASATNRGALSSANWTTFNGKQNALNGTGFVKISGTTISYDNSTYQPLLTNPITGTGTTNYLPKFTGASALGNSLIYDNGTNVGIGTTSPDSTLTVNGTGSSQIRLRSNEGNRGFLYVDGTEFALGTSTSIPLNIQTNGSTKMTVTSSGNVGIGTTSPTRKLHVDGGIRTTAFYEISNGLTNIAAIGSAEGIFGTGGNDFIFYNPNATSDVFYTSGTESMRITSGGNVGIGTTSPNALLDVAADALINGVTVGAGPSNIVTNTVVGFSAASSLTTGYNNNFIGSYAATMATDCNHSTVIGGYLNTAKGNFNDSETLSIEKPDVALNSYIGESAGLPHIWSPKTIKILDVSSDVLVRMRCRLYSSIFMEYNLEDTNGNMRAGSIKAIWNADASTIKVTEETTDSIGITSGCVIELVQDGAEDIIVRFTNTNGFDTYCNTTSRLLIRPIIQIL